MKKALISFLGTISLLCGNFTANAQDNVTIHKLSNGMEVWLNEDHSSPSVLGMVVVRAGAKECPDTGIAHYFEHIMFKGTDKIGTVDYEREKPLLDSITEQYRLLKQTSDAGGRKKIQARINELSVEAADYAITNEFANLTTLFGGSGLNAGTSYDYTVYYNLFSSQNMEPWLELNSERFLNPVFRMFQSELETVYEEKNMYGDMLGGLALDRLLDAVFAPHPYSKPVIGSTENLKNPDMDAMREFYEQYYVSGNMALILSGDFDTGQALPLIEKYFSRIPEGEAPIEEYEMPRAFKGKEMVKVKLPIPLVKMGLNIWRTVPRNHPDEYPLAMAMNLLNNSNSTGYLDRLSTDRKILFAVATNMNLNDAGVVMAVYIPKYMLFGLRGAEKQVFESFEKIKRGDFTEEEFNNVKLEYLQNHLLNMENMQGRTFMMASVYSAGISWDDYLAQQNRMPDITKEEVVAVANKYFGKDQLFLTKKAGNYEKDNLEKPGFDPVKPQTEISTSQYAQELISRHMRIQPPRTIDMEKDVSIASLPSGDSLFVAHNPYNEVFTLTVRFNVGSDNIPSAPYLADYLGYLGAGDMTELEFQEKLRAMGSSIFFSADSDSFIIKMYGFDEHFTESWELLKYFVNNVKDSAKARKNVLGAKKVDDRMLSRDSGSLSSALSEYMLYGDNSEYLRDMSYGELEKYPKDGFLKDFMDICMHDASIYYAGTMTPEELSSIVGEGIIEAEKRHTERAWFPLVNHDGQKVYIINTSEARQSIVNAMINVGELTEPRDRLLARLFNMYLGGSMNSVLFREMREYRSYAYLASSYMMIPKLYEKDHTGILTCSMTTQSDKTVEAIATLDSLVRNIEFTPERFEQARVQIINDMNNSYPGFRDMPRIVDDMLKEGHEEDVRKEYFRLIEGLTIADIEEFYAMRVKNKPFALSVATDKKELKSKEFERFGEVKVLKARDVLK